MRKCLECGGSLGDKKSAARFCSSPCRKSWNNRRMVRGAELYDAFMAMRYDRHWSRAVGMWQLICRLASDWKNQDESVGRPSYIRPDDWVLDNGARLRSMSGRAH